MKKEEVLDVALQTAKIFLESGAEIYRVEFTINTILKAYNLQGSYFVISSGIFITVHGDDGKPMTQVECIFGNSINISRLEKINNFSRQLERQAVSYEQAIKILSEIKNVKPYPLYFQLISAAFLSFMFSFFFDSTVYEAITAGIIAVFVYLLQVKILSKYFFTFFDYFIASFFGSLLCAVAAKIFPSLNLIRIIIGTIMILVPGSSITNAMKDALNGDIVSSTYKFSETIFIAIAISAGIAMTFSLVMRW